LNLNNTLSKSKRLRKDSKKRKRFRVSYLSRLLRDEVLSKIKPLPFNILPKLEISKDNPKHKQHMKWYGFFRNKRCQRLLRRVPVFAQLTYGINIEQFSQSLVKHIEWYEEVVRSKGEVYTVKLFKRVRDACLRFAANQSFERINELKLHQDGLPLRVGHLREFLSSSQIGHRRAGLLILDIIKLCEVEGDPPSDESIVTPIPELSEIIDLQIGKTIRVLGYNQVPEETLKLVDKSFRSTLERMFPSKYRNKRLEELKSLNDIHMSVRKGPNGSALGTVAVDNYAIRKSGLYDHILNYCQLVEHAHLLAILNEFDSDQSVNDLAELERDMIDSRLSIKYEAWGKSRFFAICDWFTQSALLGLHHWIFSWLFKQREDGTKDQDQVAEVVRTWTVPPGLGQCHPGVYSLDLSKATDRLPAHLQREIISHIFSKEIAEQWYTIVTNRSFQKPDKSFIQFQVGQPLGAYSSWAMLALTHHVVCRTALKLSGQTRGEYPLYVVIGDDVAMLGKQLAEWYQVIMVSILRVDISKTKGFTPDTCIFVNPLSPHSTNSFSAEIAKRVFIDGFELTTVSPETLLSGFEYPNDFPNLIFQVNKRGGYHSEKAAVAPILLSCLGFKPDMNSSLITFPLRGAKVSLDTEVSPLLGKMKDVLNFLPWFDSEITISDSELDTMWRWSIRSSLKGVLDKFKSNYDIYVALIRGPKQWKERVYCSRVQEYISLYLLNRGMLYIIELLRRVDILNFFKAGHTLEKIADLLNTMMNFELALKGKPSNKRENQNRLRNRIISNLLPRVRKSVAKAKENWGILLIDAGETQVLDLIQYNDIDVHNLECRDILTHETSKLVHDSRYADLISRAMQRLEEVE